jgi:excisionase family DNA binding protein
MAPLMDAKAAGQLLGVPYTWLLAQARSGRVPHHKLGHYVRFDQADLERWLDENRGGPELSPMVGGPSVSHQAVRSVSSMRGRPAAAGPIGRR